VDVYILLSSLDDANGVHPGEENRPAIRQDALRFGKTLEDGGSGQMSRLEEFAYLISSVAGRPLL
jgi:hypothetical protein